MESLFALVLLAQSTQPPTDLLRECRPLCWTALQPGFFAAGGLGLFGVE